VPNPAQLPTDARPGDVANGHMMTESGTWIPLTEEGRRTHGDEGRRGVRGWFTGRLRAVTFSGILALGIGAWSASQWLPHAIDSWRGAASHQEEAAALEVSQEEADAVHLTDVELWEDGEYTWFVAHLDAAELEREVVGAVIEVSVLDGSGAVIGQGTAYAFLAGGSGRVVAGVLEPEGADLLARTVKIDAWGYLVGEKRTDPGLEVTGVTAEVDDFWGPQVLVTLTAAEKARAALTVVVRDGDGAIVHVGTRPLVDVGPVPETVEMRLTALDELPEGHEVQVAVAPQS